MKKNILLVCFLLLTFSFGLSAEEKAEGKNTNSEVKNNSAQLKSKSDADAKPVSDFKKELPKLIVFDIKPEKGVDSGSANLLTEIVLDEVSAIFKNKYKIIGQKDIDKMLFWETNKQLKNCTESSCLMQIAGAMGAEFYVEGSVGTIGDKFVLTLKYIDALKVEILSRKTVVIEKDENRLIDSVKEVISEILNGKTLGNGANKTGRQLPEDKTKKEVVLPQPQTGIKQPVGQEKTEKRERRAGLKIAGYTLIGAGVLGSLLGLKFHLDANDIKNNYDMTPEQAAKANQDYKDKTTAAAILYSAGGACIVGGIISLIFSARKEGEDRVALVSAGEQFFFVYRF